MFPPSPGHQRQLDRRHLLLLPERPQERVQVSEVERGVSRGKLSGAWGESFIFGTNRAFKDSSKPLTLASRGRGVIKICIFFINDLMTSGPCVCGQ